jgi:hypothetical protein
MAQNGSPEMFVHALIDHGRQYLGAATEWTVALAYALRCSGLKMEDLLKIHASHLKEFGLIESAVPVPGNGDLVLVLRGTSSTESEFGIFETPGR